MTFLRFNIALALAAALSLLLVRSADAMEGGSSHYFPGTYNDFGMNLKLPAGFYFRNDYTYYGAQLPSGATLGRFGVLKLDQDLWTTLFKLAWASDFEVLGASYGAALILPVVLDANLSGSIQFGPREVSSRGNRGNRGGMGDMVAAPLSLTWQWGDFHVNLSEYVFMPTGFYDPDKVVNLGRNYWSFDTVAGLTWLDPKGGHEVSFKLGYMGNTRNDATQYQSGDELHLDYTVAQYFSEAFAVGVTGYYYTQLGNDRSPLLDKLTSVRNTLGLPGVGGFRSEAAGIGPALLYNPEIAGKRVAFIGKWLHEFDVKNRFDGDLAMLSVALEF